MGNIPTNMPRGKKAFRRCRQHMGDGSSLITHQMQKAKEMKDSHPSNIQTHRRSSSIFKFPQVEHLQMQGSKRCISVHQLKEEEERGKWRTWRWLVKAHKWFPIGWRMHKRSSYDSEKKDDDDLSLIQHFDSGYCSWWLLKLNASIHLRSFNPYYSLALPQRA